MENNKVEILKLKINKDNLHDVLKQTNKLVNNNEKFYVCAPNAYIAAKAHEDAELCRIINNAKIVIPDGMPFIWYSRTFSKIDHIPERIDGNKFFFEFSKIANRNNYSYFFLGGENIRVLEKIEKRINQEFKNIEVKGYFCPPFMDDFTDEINDLILEKINNCKPDILWVGLSAPKQERWIHKNFNRLDIKMAAGIGAVFNFYSANVKRAPIWMQKTGLEWLHRIYTEPRRLFKKYMIYNTEFIILVFTDLLKRALSKKSR